MDADCDGASDLDADGDGFDSDAYGGTDCSDTDADIAPGASEECDEVDSDCDGSLVDDIFEDADRDGLPDCIDDSLDLPYSANWLWNGPEGAWTGRSLAFYENQLIIGAIADVDETSRTYLIEPGDPGIIVLEDEAISILSTAAGVRLGIDVMGIDNSAGEPKLIIGISYAHSVASLDFPSEDIALTEGSRGDPAVIAAGESSYCGHTLIGGAMLSGGEPAVLIGCPETYSGAVLVAVDDFEAASSTDDLYSLGYSLSSAIDDSDDVGLGIASGDLNGDGIDDANVGTHRADFVGRNSGAVHVYLGPIEGDMPYYLADATIWGNETEDFLGGEVNASTDWDGDGTVDLIAVAGTGPATWEVSDDGSVHFFTGDALLEPGYRRADDGFSTIHADGSASWQYAKLQPLGDIDGDGSQDLMIGVPLDDLGGHYSGALYTELGPIPSGSSTLDSDTYRVAGEEEARLGWDLLSADLDGDGVDELVVSAPIDDQVFGIFTSTLIAE